MHSARAFISSVILIAASTTAAISEGKFEGRLVLEDVASLHIDDGKYDPGHTEFKLKRDYSYIDASGRKWTAPAGTVVNGASIPKVAWSVMGGPWSGEHRNAAVIHDYLCAEQYEDSDTVHRIFYEGLIANGVGAIKAKIMYFAVRKAGPRWKKGAGLSGLLHGSMTEGELKAFSNREDLETLSLDEIDKLAD